MSDVWSAAEAWSRQLRKGILDLVVLARLRQGPTHGYALIQDLKENGFMPQQGAEATLYQTLQRLAKTGLAQATWSQPDPDQRPRKMYEITVVGQAAYEDMVLEWNALRQKLEHLEESP